MNLVKKLGMKLKKKKEKKENIKDKIIYLAQ